MNLHRKLEHQAAHGKPIRIGLIGAGKFGSMFLAQVRRTVGMHILAIADPRVDAVRAALPALGWRASQYDARNLDEAQAKGTTFIIDDAQAMISSGRLDVIVEATGDPEAGVRHALAAIEQGSHLVMVNVEADVLAGPILAKRAQQAGLVYSLAYGDQPALICEMVDWARTCGFEVVCAGKGTRYLEEMHSSTPSTVWRHFGIREEEAVAAGMNPKMFNSFIDGTKSAIEMAAVANACGLRAPSAGLAFLPCSTDDLPLVLRPQSAGGRLEDKGMVEVVSDLERDGRRVRKDLRWGVFVTIEAPTDYVRACFGQYGLITDPSGCYAAMYRPAHLIGLELGVSIASAALRAEPTGCPVEFAADVVATAKRDLPAGLVLDGEGGACVYGKLLPASASIALDALPIGLAHDRRLARAVKAGACLTRDDVVVDPGDMLWSIRDLVTGCSH